MVSKPERLPSGSGAEERGNDPGERFREVPRDRYLRVMSEILSLRPLVTTSIPALARQTGVPIATLVQTFPDLHALGAAVLDHERNSMHAVMLAVARDEPIGRLTKAFQLVGQNLAGDIVVRAGVRIASESRELFPERRLDPFQTWSTFVSATLAEAKHQGTIAPDLDIELATEVVVNAGIGTKEAISFDNDWEHAPERMHRVATTVLTLLCSRRNVVMR